MDYTVLEIPVENQLAVAERVSKLMEIQIIAAILKQQEAQFPKDLQYHTYTHVLEVLHEVVFLALQDCLSETEIELLAIAAAFHDCGFMTRRVGNEIIGADLARTKMHEQGVYTQKECDAVHRYILDTALVETPVGPRQIASLPLSGYLLDADLANFGRTDFMQKAELQRREIGQGEDIFYQKTLELVQGHSFFTTAAKKHRQPIKNRNVELLQQKIIALRRAGRQLTYYGVSLDRLGFLTQLPVLLNSSMETKEIIQRAISLLQKQISAEAVTVYLTCAKSNEIEFWALQGGTAALSGQRLPKGTGVVGWVIENNSSVLIDDVKKDPRFFQQVDKKIGFDTKNMICVPLTVRGHNIIGALQLMNSQSELGFTAEDVVFVEHVARHLAPALENSQLIERLRVQNNQLTRLDARRSEMASLIAHEFRTPLNIVRSAADLLGDTAKESADLVTLLSNGVDRMVRLIDEVRNLSIVSDSSVKINATVFDIAEVLHELKKHFTEVFTQRQQTFLIQSNPCRVKADRALIKIVLRNLIANAIRFTPDGGQIEALAKELGDCVEIAIADTGVGIPEEDQELIFQKFYEVQSIYEHSSGTFEFQSGGLGLGLPTANAILAAHSSVISVVSTEQKGSVFSFKLPMYQQ